MSRSGYVDDLDQWDLIRYRGAVKSALRGKRGQAFLRELADAMDAMPEKKLIADRLVEDGACCAIGAVCLARGMPTESIDAIDYECPDSVANAIGVAKAMAAEIEYENDEGGWNETGEQRWHRMRKWVDRQLVQT